ncbi:TPA: hypothetical protein N0F65_001087 [Lagenidium giganteum]|uniref:Ankyrin n=1 Tax=Lagenidium giganteum TaxID=4803 RepID=A0AAV2YFM8_9STRA|nr:TPA: hypothetical protein N0F65_001087 [Lagenidium giganteum]
MGCAPSKNTVTPQAVGIVSDAANVARGPGARGGGGGGFTMGKAKKNALHPQPAGSEPSTTSSSAAAASPKTPSPSHALQSPAAPGAAASAGDKSAVPPLQTLSVEELSVQFLKAVKNGDQRMMEQIYEHTFTRKPLTKPQVSLVSTSRTHSHAGSSDPAAVLINARGMWESTPLIYACQYCRLPAALWLLDQGADPSAQNEKGVTALLLASLEGMEAVVRRILDLPATVMGDGNQGEGIDKQVGIVYNSFADINVRANPLLAASMNGHIEIVGLLLAKGASVNIAIPAAGATPATKQFPLLAAAKFGHADVVRLLIKYGADFATSDANGSHALQLACEAGHSACALELLQLLPEHSSDNGGNSHDVYAAAWKRANTHGLTALHYAAGGGLADVVEYMLEALHWKNDAAFVNAGTATRQEAALLMACRKKHDAVITVLLRAGANAEQADRGNTTAIQVLQRDNKPQLIELWHALRTQERAKLVKAGTWTCFEDPVPTEGGKTTTATELSSADAVPLESATAVQEDVPELDTTALGDESAPPNHSNDELQPTATPTEEPPSDEDEFEEKTIKRNVEIDRASSLADGYSTTSPIGTQSCRSDDDFESYSPGPSVSMTLDTTNEHEHEHESDEDDQEHEAPATATSHSSLAVADLPSSSNAEDIPEECTDTTQDDEWQSPTNLLPTISDQSDDTALAPATDPAILDVESGLAIATEQPPSLDYEADFDKPDSAMAQAEDEVVEEPMVVEPPSPTTNAFPKARWLGSITPVDEDSPMTLRPLSTALEPVRRGVGVAPLATSAQRALPRLEGPSLDFRALSPTSPEPVVEEDAPSKLSPSPRKEKRTKKKKKTTHKKKRTGAQDSSEAASEAPDAAVEVQAMDDDF